MEDRIKGPDCHCLHKQALTANDKSARRRGVQVHTNLLLEGRALLGRARRHIDFAWTKSHTCMADKEISIS